MACAYAAVDGSHHAAGAVGNLFRGTPPLPPARADSLFEIGSVTKVFTATLLARTLESPEHRMRLGSHIGPYLPPGVTNRRVRELTFSDLASYSSCLIRVAPGQNSTTYTIPELVRFLNYGGIRRGEHVKPLLRDCAPGVRYDYSTSASGFLGTCSAEFGTRRGTSSSGATSRGRCACQTPSGTWMRPSSSASRSATVRTAPSDRASPRRSLAAAGFSSPPPTTCCAFSNAQLEPQHAPRVLRAAIPATHVNHHPGRTPAVGLGWFLDQTTSHRPAFTKDGGTGGFGSYIALVPTERRGAFLVTSTRHLTGGESLRSLLGFASSGSGDAP